jgi:hypothetical protein
MGGMFDDEPEPDPEDLTLYEAALALQNAWSLTRRAVGSRATTMRSCDAG